MNYKARYIPHYVGRGRITNDLYQQMFFKWMVTTKKNGRRVHNVWTQKVVDTPGFPKIILTSYDEEAIKISLAMGRTFDVKNPYKVMFFSKRLKPKISKAKLTELFHEDH